MKTSQKGIDLIKKFEGCRLDAYKCPAGVLTIGYGHTAGVTAGQKISPAQAEVYLRTDLEKYEKNVEKYNNRYSWTQNEFDALVSFAFNIGSIDKLIANGTRTKAVIAEKILLYNKAGGKVLTGLTKRRQAERELFLSGAYEKDTSVEKSSAAAGGIKEYSLKADGSKAVSKNFKVKEFRCKDGSDKILIDVDSWGTSCRRSGIISTYPSQSIVPTERRSTMQRLKERKRHIICRGGLLTLSLKVMHRRKWHDMHRALAFLALSSIMDLCM